MSYKIFEYDAYLKPFESDIELRMNNYHRKKQQLLGKGSSLSEFANGHEYFGFHKDGKGWYYREWAPAADAVYIMGDMNGWNPTGLPLRRLDNGVFEIYLEGEHALYHGCKVKTVVEKDGKRMERIPLYARRVVQDPVNYVWSAEIVDETPYKWKKKKFTPPKNLFIYECHIGMAQEKAEVGSYQEFRDNILPRIRDLGYNTIQIMAIMEHPYYGSFGYQVSSFFAASSRYGMPEDLKSLIDTAHEMGIAVLLDVIHSHAVKNTAEGINEFDGTDYQFFHTGERGNHPAWDTKLFNYDKNEVIHFLLSNLKFWMTEYHFDGFRFDGVTSMIYRDHGLGTAFTDYSKYFSLNTDTEAITYLQLANELIREVNPKAITIAEDMSAMPGMCLPIAEGGVGFDYRLSMGVPDMWIKLLKGTRDEFWNMRHIWHELAGRRPMEKYIGYSESHDQALVGDKTIMFWLCDSAMYTAMSKTTESAVIDRGIALHKMIRLVTMSLAGEGYLNFMGNEFGHPEWIDFPREGNGWSYHYCRRQWHLADDKLLKYEWLQQFDKAMVELAKEYKIHSKAPVSLYIDEQAQVLVYERGGLVFALNFSPNNSYDSYFVRTPNKAGYRPVLTTDEEQFGGWNRIATDMTYQATLNQEKGYGFSMYLPARTGVCLTKVKRTYKKKTDK
ncbi:MAG: alpha amylase C-terminal domain-containing protein [Lachnospiraceae bacterium]|nr:alpha amylase C-terminal domain-containing protein [Lachnospiraceae bacterium]